MYRCKIMLAMISIASCNMIGNQGNSETSSDIEREEEWHMDWVPTGYLPDSVYRELAWYGILQVQPLYRSAKHKVAARWIWQNTLGRPYVITEHQTSRQNEDTVSRQAIAEESAKWSREHRMAQDVLMENIRTGGNGLTVRTVISDTQKSIYMIQNGVYYECETGSEPDVEAFRTQANMHERKCTFDKQAELRPVDPCLDAEAAPLEYSFLHGWMFCLSDGERENTHLPNGDLDCGRKIKISFNDFIKKCAVDHNVVITYEYFGDEPRKDMVHNTTLCTSWDPCRISYLYRIETEPAPELPTASPDQCDTTVCPACLEDGEPSISIRLQEESTIQPTERATQQPPPPATTPEPVVKAAEEPIVWVPTNSTAASSLAHRAFVAGKEGWDGSQLWVIRAHHGGDFVPGKLAVKHLAAFIPYAGKEVPVHNFEVLCAPSQDVSWVPATNGEVPAGAIAAGNTHNAEQLYIARVNHSGSITPGNVRPSHGCCYISFSGIEISFKKYEVLCKVG